MSLTKLLCMFSAGVFMILISATPSSACSHDHSTLPDSHVEQVNHRGETAVTSVSLSGDHKRIALKNHNDARGKVPAKATVALAAVQDDDDFEYGGSCIHAGGCTCSGRRSHTRTCGTQGDCHAHSGLVCTWGGFMTE